MTGIPSGATTKLPNAPRILVIDDEPAVTQVIRRLLVKQGFEVTELNDPQKVEDYILYTELNLVITDLRMPGLDGLGVLKFLRVHKPNLRVIILTGHGGIESAVEATKLGAAEFMTKPFDHEELVRVVNKHALADKKVPDHIKAMIASPGFTSRADRLTVTGQILLKNEILSTDNIPNGFVEVEFDNIVPGEPLPFELYIQVYNRNSNQHFLRRLCTRDEMFTSGMRNILYRRRLGSAYILEEDYRAYLQYTNNLKSMPHFQAEKIKETKKLVLYGKAIEAVSDILSVPEDSKNIRKGIDLVDNLFQRMVKDPELYQDMFYLFKQDFNLFSHSTNVCLLMVSFGLFIGLKEETVNHLGQAALFHDLGLAKIDRAILEKSGPLSPEEWRLIKKHPEKGNELLKQSLIFPKEASRIILEHHEADNGSGYPRGLKGRSNLQRRPSVSDRGPVRGHDHRKALSGRIYARRGPEAALYRGIFAQIQGRDPAIHSVSWGQGLKTSRPGHCGRRGYDLNLYLTGGSSGEMIGLRLPPRTKQAVRWAEINL